ncbi:MAG TPA: SOS response-associated peptidase [Prolixibacteraceae bacterium]|nr:SOS response-associated peptidase [Prolixibacteraceae bacterium]
MCRKFVLASELQRIEPRFNAKLGPDIPEIPKLYAASEGDETYIITGKDPNLIQVFKFGMTPFYADKPLSLINARAEGDKNSRNDPGYTGSNAIFLKPAFRKPIQFQRCLVITDAYYEWSTQNKPYLVYLQNKKRPFVFAGLYDQWINPDTKETVFTFTIISTTANPLLQSLGVKRMPVILSRSEEMEWIRASNHLSDVLGLLNAYPYEKMNAYPVSEKVNWKCNNDPSMLNPTGEKLLKEVITQPLQQRGFHKEKPSPEIPWFQSRQKPEEIK